jgi:hypothetical protein
VVNSIEDHDMSVALLRKIIETTNYDRLSLARIQPLLPAGGDELEDLIDQFLAENARMEFRLAVRQRNPAGSNTLNESLSLLPNELVP